MIIIKITWIQWHLNRAVPLTNSAHIYQKKVISSRWDFVNVVNIINEIITSHLNISWIPDGFYYLLFFFEKNQPFFIHFCLLHIYVSACCADWSIENDCYDFHSKLKIITLNQKIKESKKVEEILFSIRGDSLLEKDTTFLEVSFRHVYFQELPLSDTKKQRILFMLSNNISQCISYTFFKSRQYFVSYIFLKYLRESNSRRVSKSWVGCQ